MGEVYEATDLLLDRRVAIKVLSPSAGSSAARQVKRLVEEARAVARLEHPNIVTVYQVGEQQGSCFIAMQLVPGVSAGARVRAEGPLPVAEAARIIDEAARGLAAAHDLGLVHRDIKPDNILLGENGAVKVADFGLARQYGFAPEADAHEPVAGTPHYMSPEQAQGLPIDARSDIYSLGVTWYDLLAGRPPFDDSGVTEVIARHVSDPPPPVASFRPDIPEGHAALLEWMMAKAPGQRPQSAREVVDALRSLAPRAGAAARQPPRERNGWRESLRHYATIAGAVTAGIVGVLLGNQFWSASATDDVIAPLGPAAPATARDAAPPAASAPARRPEPPREEKPFTPPGTEPPPPSRSPPLPIKAPPQLAPEVEDAPPPGPRLGPPSFPPDDPGGFGPPPGPGGPPPPPPPPRGGRGRP
jgi:serine/threonine protein kinase